MKISKIAISTNKVLCAVLCVVMFLSVLPYQFLQATNQNAVTDLIITRASSVSSNPYSFVATWSRPLGQDPLDNVYYNISVRNATAGGAYVALQGHTENEIDDSQYPNGIFSRLVEPNFQNGSIYLIKVFPRHTHVYPPDPNTGVIPSPQTHTPSATAGSEALFLTDIQVSAGGLNDSMSVEWSSASFLGNDIFDGYKITCIPRSGGREYTVVVPKNDPGLKLNGASRMYSYTFSGDFNPGYYTVYVEPQILNNGRYEDFRKYCTDRQTDPEWRFRINNVPYSVLFTNNDYSDTNAYVEFGLTSERETQDYVRLNWKVPLMEGFDIIRVEILSLEREITNLNADLREMSPKSEAVFLNRFAESFTTVLLYKPYIGEVITSYMLVVTYRDRSNSDRLITEKSLVHVYYPRNIDYTPTKPTILDITEAEEPLSLDIDWEAFTRPEYYDNEINDNTLLRTVNGLIIDENIKYDIWVTDDINLLDNPAIEAMRINTSDYLASSYPVYDNNGVPYFSFNAKEYLSFDGVSYSKKPIEDNKVYYIKVIATRTDGDRQVSEPAYGSYFIMPKDPVIKWPLMINRLPLRLGEITTTKIDVEWDLKWFEIYDETTNGWYSTVGVDASGNLVFDKASIERLRDDGTGVVFDLNDKRYTSSEVISIGENNIYNDLDIYSSLSRNELEADYPVRFMDLTGADFELHVAEYDEIEENGGYDAYISSITNDTSKWTVVPPFEPENPSYTVWPDEHTPQLEPNKTYVILFRPFINMGDGQTPLKAYYPNILVATTSAEPPVVIITPTVPVLLPVKSNSTSLVVRFQYNEGLKYELAYAESLGQFNNGGGKVIVLDNILPGDIQTDAVTGKKFVEYTIEKLFPETIYYIRICSYADNLEKKEYSEWSNPITMETTELEAPEKPSGLGPASRLNLDYINKENNLQYKPYDMTYLAVEWLKDLNHQLDPALKGVLDVSGNEILSSPNITEMLLVKFNNLIANRGYYIRVKTVLTVTKSNENGINSFYQYVVQLSQSSEFLDTAEVTVQPTVGPLDPIYTTSKESAWSDVIYIYTGRDENEYDGTINPEMYPLPEDDFEWLYERETDTLTYRFRSNQTGEDGKKDNGADQRFITSLLQNKTFHYSVDLTLYKNKAVANAVLELPYSIVAAFDERQISLTIIMGDTSYTFEPGFLKTAAVNSLAGFGADGKVRFVINKNPKGVSAVSSSSEILASTLQKLTIQATTAFPERTVSLAYTSNPVVVTQKLTNRYITLDKNVGSYSNSNESIQWERQNDRYNNVSGELTFATSKMGYFAAVAKDTPQQNSNANSEANNFMYSINSKMNFRDLKTYDPNAFVTANVVNKIIAAIANGAKEVYINQPLTAGELSSLTNANWLVGGQGQPAVREEAISALVMLYETKTKSLVRNYPDLNTTFFRDIALASPQYQTALLKAEKLGFYGNAVISDPKSYLTYADLLRIIDYIMTDAGM